MKASLLCVCAAAALLWAAELVNGQVFSTDKDTDVSRAQDLRQSGIYHIDESEWPENGVPGDVNVYPSYDERSTNVWINVVCSSSSTTPPPATSKFANWACADHHVHRHESGSRGTTRIT